MYSWEKSFRGEKPNKNPKNPSFSSSLLDEIYRSIDGNDEKSEERKLYKERSYATSTRKYSHSYKNYNGGRTKSSSIVEDEEMASLKRACLIEKWMEKKVTEKVSSQRKELVDSDPLFFSSSSSSSDSSSGGLSSSDAEFFASANCRKSCFASSSRPKPVRTSVLPRLGQQKNELLMYSSKDLESNETEENLIKSKSRALKIYANLKKVKQPISPGGRLASFINNLFANGNARKSKNFCENANMERKPKISSISNQVSLSSVSTCSSASSFSRSCLSKTSPNSRAKYNDGAKRTVRFYPVSVIVDEDSRPCGHKCIYDRDSDKFDGRPSIMSQNAAGLTKIEGDFLKAYHQNQKKETLVPDRRMIQDHEEGEYDDDDEDAASDSSSDLFEIDHLALFGNSRFQEELPVYETTHLDTNQAIANGLIR